MAKHKCLSCEVVIDFEPVYCCSGRECGCKGLPIDPPLCGDCERELFKMAKINQEEYEVLKDLDDKWKWIARNYNGALITYTDKPMKNPNLYWDSFGERMDDRLFKFIQWEDESPYNIQELIEEYENSPEYVTYISNERTRILSNDLWSKLESEETEVKNIEELKSWFEDEKLYVGEYVKHKINQLDEPEVLSQEEEQTPETVADVMVDFSKSLERLKEVLGMELKD